MEPQGEVKLARTLGLGSIVLLGVGALLGGGIFTLLGPAAGLAGPGLFLSMILGAILAFLNLQMYIALGTTFPEAGGGYLWVKKGLGDFQGFLSGWMSWFAHAAAAGLYALSFGYYAFEIFKVIFKDDFGLDLLSIEKIFGIGIVVILGYLNWKGAKSSRLTGNIVDGVLIGVLALFILAGAIKIFSAPAISFAQYTPFLPNAIFGIISAAALFYIAFEGSEIQVQTGEETKDPKRALRVGLFGSWAIVSAIYILVAAIIMGATHVDGPIGQVLSGWGEGAIAKSAAGFLPFGYFVMLVGGVLANLGALNATIYSCSRVAFALARDRNIWTRLANIHLKNLSPHLAVVISTLLIAAMVGFLPLFDVAALASLLFILLFLQLNIAGINIHYKWPDTQWAYRVPMFPITPLIAVVAYILLAITMLQVNLSAWVIAAFWMLLGLINYFSYVQTRSRKSFETGIVYEEAVRIGPKTGKRILLPLAPYLSLVEIKNLAETAFALTSKFDGELVIVRIHEIPPSLALSPTMISPKTLEQEKKLFEQLQQWVTEYNVKTGPEKKDINFHSLILIGRDVVDVILDVVKMEDCDLLMLNWYGYKQTKGVMLSSKIDRILRESKCDLLVVKDPQPMQSILVAVHPSARSPYIEQIGEIVGGLKDYYKPKMHLLGVLDWEIPSYLKPDPTELLKALKLKRKDFEEISLEPGDSVAGTILKKANNQKHDLIIIGSAQPKFLSHFKLGSVAEILAKHSNDSLMIVRGHEGAAEAFFKQILSKFKPKQKSQ